MEILFAAKLMKVMIVDENSVIREKIAGLLSRLENIDAVSQLSSTGRLEEAVLDIRPQIILLDAGIVCREKEKVRTLQQKNEAMRLIVLTENNKEFFERSVAAADIRIDNVINKQDVFESMKWFVEEVRTRDNCFPQS